MNDHVKALGPVVSDKKIFFTFPYISLCKTSDPLGWAIFGPRAIILNKLGKGLLGDINGLGLLVSARRFFHVFLI